MKCELCSNKVGQIITAAKNDQVVRFYECLLCGHSFERISYAYTPYNCPKHLFVFSYRIFIDNPDRYSLDMVFKCDRCGAKKTEKQDMRSAGMLGKVDIEHPLVFPTLRLNKSVAERILDKEQVRDFWKDTDKTFLIDDLT